MKKKVKKLTVVTGAALATVAGVAVSGQNAHADATSTASSNTTVESPAQQQHEQAVQAAKDAQVKADQAGQKVSEAQNNVDVAQGNVNRAQADADAQQAKVNEAQKTADDAQVNLNKANEAVKQAEANVKNATQANINQASDAIDSQKDKLSQDSQAINSAQDATKNAQTAVDNANQEVKDAQTVVSAKSDAVKDAQKGLDQANEALKGTNLDKLQQAYDQASDAVKANSDAVDKAQSAVNASSDALSAAKSATQAAQTAVDNAQDAVNTKSSAASDAAKAYSDAKKATSDAQEAIATTKDSIKGAKDALSNINKIDIPAGYAEALKKFSTDYSSTRDASREALANIAKEGMKNTYKSNKADRNHKVNFSQNQPLSEADETELSQFVAQLLNPLVKEVGAPELTINKGILSFAKSIAQRYDQDNWNIFTKNWHDCQGINDVAKDYGLTYMTGVGATKGQEYEDLQSGNWFNQAPHAVSTNMDALKEQVYGAVKDMLFDDADSNWGHAVGITGLGKKNSNATDDNIAVTLDSMEQVHIINVSPSIEAWSPIWISNATKDGKYQQLMGDTVAVSDPVTQLNNQKQTLENALTTQQADLTTKQNAEKRAKDANDQASQALSTAKSALTQAQSELATKQNAEKQANTKYTNDQNTLTAAQQKLANSKTAKTTAQNNLGAVTADQATKLANVQRAQQAVDNAKQAEKQAQDALTTKQSVLKTAKDTLATKQQAVKDAQTQLKTDQEQLTKLQNKLNGLKNAAQVLTQAKANQQASQRALNDAQSALTSAKAALAPLQDAVSRAKSDLTAAQQKLASAQQAKQEADAKLAAANEAAKTDAEKYGDAVQVSPIIVKEGAKSLPSLKLANPEEGPILMASFMVLSAMAAPTLPTVPYGTKINWNDPAQALRDLAHAGNYAEEALITFPDGSTVVKKFAMKVLAPEVINHNNSSANTEGNHIVDNHVVDDQGNTVAGLTVKNGHVYNAQGQDVTAQVLGTHKAIAKNGKVTASAARKQSQHKQLPQTGNESSVLAALGLMTAGMATMLGLSKRDY